MGTNSCYFLYKPKMPGTTNKRHERFFIPVAGAAVGQQVGVGREEENERECMGWGREERDRAKSRREQAEGAAHTQQRAFLAGGRHHGAMRDWQMQWEAGTGGRGYKGLVDGAVGYGAMG